MGPTRSVALAFAAAALLAACSSDPEPKFEDPTPSPSASQTSASPIAQSPSPTPTVTPSAPALPQEATVNSPEGANAFARWWVALVNHAQATGNTSTLQTVNDSRCSGCSGIVHAITEGWSNGGSLQGGVISIKRFRELPLDHGADWAAVADGSVEPQTTIKADGSQQTSARAPLYVYVYALWSGDHWGMRWVDLPVAKDRQ